MTEGVPPTPHPHHWPREADLRALPAAMVATGMVWLGPYFATSSLYFRGAIAAATLLFVLAIATDRMRLSRESVILAGAFALLMLYYTAHTPGRLFDPSSGWVALLLFVLMDRRSKGESFVLFRYVFAICLIPAIVVWVLSAVGIDVPWSYLYSRRFDADVLTGIEGSYYREYFGFSVVRNTEIITMGFGTIFRLHGIFEEPGVIGTISGLLLVASQVRLRRRPENVIILIGGLLSFSLAFYAIMYAYLVYRRPIVTAACTVMLVLAGSVVLGLTDQFSFLNAFLVSRLLKANVFSDATRVSPVFQNYYAEFWRSDLSTRLFGSPHDISDLVDSGSFSYKVVIFQYGIVGFTALISALSAATLAISRRKDALALLALLIVSIAQRPNVLSLPYEIILLGGAAVIEIEFQARRMAAAVDIGPAPLPSGG